MSTNPVANQWQSGVDCHCMRLRETGRNPYGDPKGTSYAGGTPLFDERTGARKDRYEYILEKHPELRKARG